MLAVVIAVCLVAAVALLAVWRGMPRKAAIAWELAAPAGERWTVGFGGSANCRTSLGRGDTCRAVWVDAAGQQFAASPASSNPWWRCMSLHVPDPSQGFYLLDNKARRLQLLRAGQSVPVTVDLAGLPVTPEAKPRERVQFSLGRDGQIYLLTTSRDLAVFDAAGQPVGQISLGLNVATLHGVRSDGRILAKAGDDRLACFVADGRIAWQQEFPAGYYLIEREGADGSIAVAAAHNLLQLDRHGAIVWSVNAADDLGLPTAAIEDLRYYQCPGGWIANYGDVLLGVEPGRGKTWEIDLSAGQGYAIHSIRADRQPAGDGVVVLLEQLTLSALKDAYRQYQARWKDFQPPATHVARVSAAGERTGVWSLPAGDYLSPQVGEAGAVYLMRAADPVARPNDFTLCRIELP